MLMSPLLHYMFKSRWPGCLEQMQNTEGCSMLFHYHGSPRSYCLLGQDIVYLKIYAPPTSTHTHVWETSITLSTCLKNKNKKQKANKRYDMLTATPPPSPIKTRSPGVLFCSCPLQDIMCCSLRRACSLKSTVFCINAGRCPRYHDYFCRERKGGAREAEVPPLAPSLLWRLLTDPWGASVRCR